MPRKKQSEKPHVASFFAGIGGFDIGFENAGMQAAFQCENKDFCNEVLVAHWPDVTRKADITDVLPSDIPVCDVWAGGFPCQDVSLARGRLGRDGLQGSRSGLFHTMMALIRERMPQVVLLENVLGLRSSNEGRDLLTVIESLTSVGYAVSWRVVNTRYFGAPQSRPRVYICAWLNNPVKAVLSLYEPTPAPLPSAERNGFIRPYSENGVAVPETAFCLAATSGRHTGTDWSRTYIAYADRVRRITPEEAEGIQGFPRGWTLPTGLGEAEPDDIDSLRYYAIGNAVSPPVVEWIAKRIRECLVGRMGEVGANIDASILPLLPNAKPRERSIAAMAKESSDNGKISWSSGGIAFGDVCVDVRMSTSPVIPIQTRLIDVVDKGYVDSRYFLSRNAAIGILRRVRNQKRTLFNPLYEALRVLAGEKSREGKLAA